MPHEKQPRVFVYGTLKPGGYYWPRFCEGRVLKTVRARVKGRLFALPAGYPALVLGDGWAWGYLLTLQDSAVLAGFDMLEGYQADRLPSENEYQRVEVEVYNQEGGSEGTVWAYVMEMREVTSLGGVIISSGDWTVNDPEHLPGLD